MDVISRADKQKAEDYFDMYVIGYMVHDLDYVLEWKTKVENHRAYGEKVERLVRLDRPALFLWPIFSGIDSAGGTIFGFGEIDAKGKSKDNSKKRSVCFMEKYMGLEAKEAQFLYESMRCGLFHQGTASFDIEFFVYYNEDVSRDEINPKVILSIDGKGIAHLDCVSFAYKFKEGIENLRNNREDIKFFPKPRKNDDQTYVDWKRTKPLSYEEHAKAWDHLIGENSRSSSWGGKFMDDVTSRKG
jgi:hypothetical protein